MRLLLLYPRLPYPPDKGDKIRTCHQFEYLSNRHEVWCACFIDDRSDWAHVDRCARRCRKFEAFGLVRGVALGGGALSLARGRSLTEGYLRDGRMMGVVREWSRHAEFEAVLCFGSGMGVYALGADAKRRCVDLCDLDSAKWADYAARRPPPGKWLYELEARRVGLLERELIERFDATILITGSEANGTSRAANSSRIHIVGNGVDSVFAGACGVPAREPVLAFVGAMDYWPNQDAVSWFAETVWAELRRRVPKAEWVIVGRNPPRRVRRLSGLPGVSVTGRVPEVVSYLRGTRVVVAPMRVGRGIQNKVLEGMACQRPVVATSVAARGIAERSLSGLTIADSPGKTVDRLETLLSKPGCAEEEGTAARRWVEAHFRWGDKLAELEQILQASSYGDDYLTLSAAQVKEPVPAEVPA